MIGKPHTRCQPQRVAAQFAFEIAQGHRHDAAVESARIVAAVVIESDRALLPDDVLAAEGLIFGQQGDVDEKRFGKGFSGLQIGGDGVVADKAGRDLDQAVVLTDAHGRFPR